MELAIQEHEKRMWYAEEVYRNASTVSIIADYPVIQNATVGPMKLSWGYLVAHKETGERYKIKAETFRKMDEYGLIDNAGIPRQVSVPWDQFSEHASEEILERYIPKLKPAVFRPSWDEYFMASAFIMSTRSTCDRLFVGAVIVKDNRIIGEGYNGSIAGHPHCDEVGHLIVEGGCKRTIHAESNALNKCTVSPVGATAYVTHYPCPDCMKLLNQSGITEVVYGSFYKHRYENDFNDGMTLRAFTGRKLKIEWEALT